jgi:ribosomal-protein-alanine N-acetyltransferase
VLVTAPIETTDLLLRSLDERHAAGPYAGWMTDAEIVRYLEVRFAPPDAATLAQFIARMNASADNLLLGLFPRSEPTRHIGNIKLGPVDRRHRCAAIGIVVGDKALWGRGLAGQAVAAVADYAFANLDLDRVEAGFYAPNEASQRAFRRAGFAEEGRLRGARLCDGIRVDEVLMSRLRDAASAARESK